jgi:hypothetical protein
MNATWTHHENAQEVSITSDTASSSTDSYVIGVAVSGVGILATNATFT